jgi:hypothetical protein
MTELETLQVVNTAVRMWHVFVSNGMFFFAISYNKTRALNGGAGKPIVRFPDALSSYLLAC